MQERRKFPRLECPKDKQCTVMSAKLRDFQGELKNISRSGTTLISKNQLKNNDKIDILIKYPELDREVPSVVEIVWSHFKNTLYTYGTKFVNIKSEDKYDLLDHFYESWKNQILSKRS